MRNPYFVAPPTVADFMNCDAFFRLIAGPVGSGKTTGCMFELLKRSMQQRPNDEGIRLTRWAIVRQTLQQLTSTVLKDINEWLGVLGKWKVSDKTVYFDFPMPDGTRCRSEWIMIPLEDPEDQRRLLSSQLTGAWMSEAIEMSVDLVSAIQGRCGRYPSAMQGGASWYGVIADTNMPSHGSEWHAKMTKDKPTLWEIFIQPGGMETHAENLEYLVQTPETLALPITDPRRREQGRKYYVSLMDGRNGDWIDRYVHARYGADPSGQTVFRASFRSHHLVKDLEPIRNRNLIIAQDFGRNPFSLIMQVDGNERLLILEEVPAANMALSTHVTQNLRPALMEERYFGLPMYFIGDPSGKAHDSVFEINPFKYLRNEGFAAYPAPTNNLDQRLGAVEQWFLKMYADGPAILIDEERCKTLATALMVKYRYAKRRSNDQLAPKPEKLHPWSDVADCLQYGCLVAGTGMGLYIPQHMARTRNSMAPTVVRTRAPSPRGWA